NTGHLERPGIKNSDRVFQPNCYVGVLAIRCEGDPSKTAPNILDRSYPSATGRVDHGDSTGARVGHISQGTIRSNSYPKRATANLYCIHYTLGICINYRNRV